MSMKIKEKPSDLLLFMVLLGIMMFISSDLFAAQSTTTNVVVDGLSQQNSGQVTSQGSYNQYNLGGGGNNFSSGDFPVYQRKGDVQCPTATFSMKAYGLQRHMNQGAIQAGITVPLTGRRCLNAFDDEVAVTQYELHVAKIEQDKRDQLFLAQVKKDAVTAYQREIDFAAKMAGVCGQLHQSVLIASNTALSDMCTMYMPIDTDHGHGEEPHNDGFTKPASHKHERVVLSQADQLADYVLRNDLEEVRLAERKARWAAETE